MNGKRYYVELRYGYEDTEEGIFHTFEAVAQNDHEESESIAFRLASRLDCTPDDDRFNWDFMDIVLPDAVVLQIQKDALEAVLAKITEDDL